MTSILTSRCANNSEIFAFNILLFRAVCTKTFFITVESISHDILKKNVKGKSNPKSLGKLLFNNRRLYIFYDRK